MRRHHTTGKQLVRDEIADGATSATGESGDTPRKLSLVVLVVVSVFRRRDLRQLIPLSNRKLALPFWVRTSRGRALLQPKGRPNQKPASNQTRSLIFAPTLCSTDSRRAPSANSFCDLSFLRDFGPLPKPEQQQQHEPTSSTSCKCGGPSLAPHRGFTRLLRLSSFVAAG